MDVSQKRVLVEGQDRHDSFLRHLGKIALFYVSLALAGAFVAFIVEVYVQFPSQRYVLVFILGALCSVASVVALYRVRLESFPTLDGARDLIELNWAVRIKALWQARMLERETRRAERNAVADTLIQLRHLRNQMQREFGKQLFASLGECTLVVVVDKDNYFGCLFFQRALENIGFHVNLVTDFGRVGIQTMLYKVIYFTPMSGHLLKIPNEISLYGIASGDIRSWDVLRETLVQLLPKIPHAVDLSLRRYFQLAASHIRVPPESLGTTKGVIDYRL